MANYFYEQSGNNDTTRVSGLRLNIAECKKAKKSVKGSSLASGKKWKALKKALNKLEEEADKAYRELSGGEPYDMNNLKRKVGALRTAAYEFYSKKFNAKKKTSLVPGLEERQNFAEEIYNDLRNDQVMNSL